VPGAEINVGAPFVKRVIPSVTPPSLISFNSVPAGMVLKVKDAEDTSSSTEVVSPAVAGTTSLITTEGEVKLCPALAVAHNGVVALA
jgi:hypothetical protein